MGQGPQSHSRTPAEPSQALIQFVCTLCNNGEPMSKWTLKTPLGGLPEAEEIRTRVKEHARQRQRERQLEQRIREVSERLKTPPAPRCWWSRKRCYDTDEEAEAVIAHIVKRGQHRPDKGVLRAYLCRACNKKHYGHFKEGSD
jgi:hypothetical protein